MTINKCVTIQRIVTIKQATITMQQIDSRGDKPRAPRRALTRPPKHQLLPIGRSGERSRLRARLFYVRALRALTFPNTPQQGATFPLLLFAQGFSSSRLGRVSCVPRAGSVAGSCALLAGHKTHSAARAFRFSPSARPETLSAPKRRYNCADNKCVTIQERVTINKCVTIKEHVTINKCVTIQRIVTIKRAPCSL